MKRSLSSVLILLLLLSPSIAVAKSPKSLEQSVVEIIKRNPKVILDAVADYQKQSARIERQKHMTQYITEPVKVDIEGFPILGSKTATLTLIEFGDFQCPYCIQAEATIKSLMAKYKDKMRLIYVNMPLPIHLQAKSAAQAAWAAGQQGKFFEYHDELFALGGNLQDETYEQIAKELGLNIEKFNQDRQSSQAAAKVEANIHQAQTLNITGTPSFVLNGILLRGAVPIGAFEEAIELLESKASSGVHSLAKDKSVVR